MRSRKLRRIIAYAAFAALASGVNLASQWCCLRLASMVGVPLKTALWPALAIGTGAGLVVKYILDKYFIFQDRSSSLVIHGRQFSLYSMMGVGTTVIFWGTEYLFSRIDASGRLVYLGGALGLLIGYTVKYELDKRFVFAASGGEVGFGGGFDATSPSK